MRYASSILSSSLGNILEWYDFGLFAIFSPLFSHVFFPQEDAHVALISTFGVFAIGFLCRPLGSLVFGYLGDTYGRAKTLRLSILIISLPTLLIGVLPSYQQIGITAPVLFTLVRMAQGFSIGGEFSGNLIYLAESAPYKNRAVFTAFANIGSNIGILLAAMVGLLTGSLFSESVLTAWGWRIPYLISGFLCLFIYLFRMQLDETEVFDYLRQKQLLTKNPLKSLLTQNMPQLIRTLGIVCMGSTFYYFCFAYLPFYIIHRLHLSSHMAHLLTSSLIAIMILLIPFSAYLCDLIGRRIMLLFNAILVTIIVIPGFYFLHIGDLLTLALVLLIFTIASSLEQGTTSVAIVENFPAHARYTGISLGYNIANGFLGGTVPFICEQLTTNTFTLAPAIYIASCALITYLVVLFFVPETKGQSLKKN